VLEAPPGAGKSTVVPLALLDAPWRGDGRIVMLEPRRIAARAVARAHGGTLGETAGERVGFRTRLETRVGPATRIEVVTEGILTRMLQHDPALEGVACVVFDEFHERNLQGDLGLALALECQRHLRPDLRLLVMSATLDGARSRACSATRPLRARPGPHVRRRDDPRAAPAGTTRTALAQPVANLILRALESHPGDVLAFLPGAGEIRRVVEAARGRTAGRARTPVLPLYGDLDGRAGCGAATGPDGPPQGRRRHQHRRDQPDDRRRAHRGRRRDSSAASASIRRPA
jgi:ATP-dependent helicase HrpB